MKKRIALIVTSLAATVAFVLAGATLAFGGPSGLIFDDGAYVKPGSLDDGKALQSQAAITLRTAVANAQRAAPGQLGQVDLERSGSRLVYMVDVGNQEVRVDAANGSIAEISPRS
jgi:peptidase YpeB-like protein